MHLLLILVAFVMSERRPSQFVENRVTDTAQSAGSLERMLDRWIETTASTAPSPPADQAG